MIKQCIGEIERENPKMERDLNKKTVPIGQAAEFLGVSVDTIRRWDEKGILHSTRPDGKDRYFSVVELEKVKFSQPLTISEAAQKLDISEATLRRLEEKELIKPERNSAGERIYTIECLEDFLKSDYFLRQETIEDKILSAPETKTEDKNDYADDVQSLRDQHRVINAQIEEQKGHIHRLDRFRKIFRYSVAIAFTTLVLLVAIFTILFLLYPSATARWFGLSSQTAEAAGMSLNSNPSLDLQDSTGGKVLGASYQPVPQSEPGFISRVLQPIGGLSLELVRQINPTTYSQIIATQAIRDVNDIFSIDNKGNIVVKYNLTLPDTSYLKIPDTNLIQNLNADYLRGKVPGDTSGDLVYWDKNNSVAGLKIDSINLADNSVTNDKISSAAIWNAKQNTLNEGTDYLNKTHLDLAYLGISTTVANSSKLNGQSASYYQTALISGTSIKTINGGSLLGSGDLAFLTALSGAVLTDQTTPQTVGDTTNRVLKLWATDITSTNAISGSVTGNAGTVTNATLSTVLSVNTGAVTLTGNIAGSILTLGAGAASISGANTGDQTLVGLGGVPTTRSLTINGTAADLSADRTWTITTITGNAGTATALQTARTIGGVSFDGTANITVASATGGFTVSGSNLVLGTNSLTMTGSLGATGARLTKGWFTDLEVTNAIAGSITGNAATVTTNANLTGDITSVGNATTLTNAPVIAKVLTGYASGAGTVAATDSILQAIQKLNGNDATNANLTGPITSVGNTTSIASQTGTGTKFVVDTAPTIAGGAISALTTLAVRDTSAAFDVTIAATSTTPLTLGRTLTLDVDNAGRTIKLGGNLTLTGDASISGTHTGTSSGTNTGDNAANSSTTYVGTTAIALNRSSAAQALTGITSIDGNAATVTTNANLTGDVTSVGNATTLTNAPVIAKVLTGYASGAGTVAATDSILQAIQKLNGNDATNANLTGVITSVGNATSFAASPTFTGTVTIPSPFTLGATSVTTTGIQLNYLASAGGTTGTTTTNLVFSTSPTLTTPALGAATYTTLNGGNITDSGLTSGRVIYAGTAGILQDSPTFTYNGTNLTISTSGTTGGLTLGTTQLFESAATVLAQNAGDSHGILLALPGAPTGTPSTTGGSMADGTYYYVITAGDAGSVYTTKGTESAAQTISGGSGVGSVALTWTAVQGASTYKVYRTTTLGDYTGSALITTITQGLTTYTDTAASPGAGSPPTSNLAYATKISSTGTGWMGGTEPLAFASYLTSAGNNGVIGLNPNIIATGAFQVLSLQPKMTVTSSNANKRIVYSGLTLSPNVAITNGYSDFVIANATLGSGATIDTHYGINFSSFSGATNNYPIYFAGTGVGNGITWGTDSPATNLYRSTTSTLKTDGNFIIGTKLTNYNSIATVSNGVPSELATVDLTAQSAAIIATTIYAVPASGAGMYRVSWVATVTTAATTSCVLGGTNGFQVKYTDADDSVVKTSNPTTVTSSSVNSTGTSISGSFVARAKASTNLQYLFDYTSVGATAMQYNLHVKIEAL